MPSLPVSFHALSDVGQQREQNEDSRGELEAAGGTLVIVCDGMGGHEAGEVASRLAVDAIGQIFKNSPADDPSERLKSGFLVANQRILAHAEKIGVESMGTTAVAAFVRDGKAWVAHVGDSRCYQLRNGEVVWKTADHTRVQKMIERGIITADQAKTHEDANVVTRALGFAKGEDKPEPDVSARDLREGDVLLLCSDGLYDLVKDDEIADLGWDDSLPSAAKVLVELANRRGGHDNITVTLLRSGTSPKRTSSRKTDLSSGGTDKPLKTAQLSKSPVSADEVARAKAETAAAREAAERSRRALILVVAGVGLVGIAIAAFMLTRGGDAPKTAGRSDGGSAGSAIAPVRDDGGVAATSGGPTDAMATGDALTPPTWTTTNPNPNTGGNKSHRDGGVGSGTQANGGDAGAGSAAVPNAPTGTGPTVTVPAGSNTGSGTGGFGTGGSLGKTDPGLGNVINPGSGSATPKAGAGSGSATTPKPGGTTPAGAGTTPKTGGTTTAPAGTTTPQTGGTTTAPAGTTTPKTGGTTTAPAGTTTPKTGGTTTAPTGTTAPKAPTPTTKTGGSGT